MKIFILASLLIGCIYFTEAQEIEATTGAGKKVLLNLDTYSWRYANSQDGQKPCYTNYMADVIIKNTTNHVIYFHYGYSFKPSSNNYLYGGVIKIQPNSEGKLERVPTRYYYGRDDFKNNEYEWKADYEQYEIYNKTWYEYSLQDIKGIDSGKFTLYECETKVIEVTK